MTNNELVQYARRGKIERVGQGVYMIAQRMPEENDPYAVSVALVGSDAYLYGESVIAMHGLAPTNPARIFVATPRRIRRKLPAELRVIQRQGGDDVVVYDAIPSQKVADAIRACIGTMLPERLADAVRSARGEGLITSREEVELIKEVGTCG
ncbi:hypothetical protein [Adlercreutzia sp. ZJ242]|uniref:hypothetical protein n=1 Tax=Adlercreutzia sp. ZJ242 TaxID=2709409 RepID=UPI001F14EA73|nr:hypothetical protein [Adlercreutzia sp. ZJ242]